MSQKLRDLQIILGNHMARIAKHLPDDYKLTLVARYTGIDFGDADIVMTDDDMARAEAAIKRLRERETAEIGKSLQEQSQ